MPLAATIEKRSRDMSFALSVLEGVTQAQLHTKLKYNQLPKGLIQYRLRVVLDAFQLEVDSSGLSHDIQEAYTRHIALTRACI